MFDHGLSVLFFYQLIIFLLCLFCFVFCLAAVFASSLIFSIFSLVFYFFTGIWFFLFFKAEYCMVLFLIIYLGAIIVFFLFVLMLLDRKYWAIKPKQTSSSVKTTIGKFCYFFVLFLFFYFVINYGLLFSNRPVFIVSNSTLQFGNFLTNTEKIGYLMYSEFGLLVLIGGVILLVTIIGCVIIIKPRLNEK